MPAAITYDLDVAAALKDLGEIRKGAATAIARVVKKAAQKALKLAKPETPKASGRAGRGRKAGGVKRLSQSLKVAAWSKRGRTRATVSWGGQRGQAGYGNFLNYGALRYTRRKILVRKDGKPTQGKLARVGAINQHNSRRSRRKGWANRAWARIKKPTEGLFVTEARNELERQAAKARGAK
jgi:hypothetical protein